MASFRRSLSPMASTDRALYNGDMVTHKFSSSPSSASPSSSSLLPIACLRAFLYGNHLSKSARPSEKPKIKIQVWKRPLIHFLLSFFVGFMIGFTPFGMEVFSANLSSKQHQPALELNAARIGSKEDFGHVGRTIDTVNMANLKDSGLEPQKVLSEQVALDVADPSTEHSPAAISISELVPRKLLIIVTPTYNRPFQAFYLNRLAHTLKLVSPPLLWIVVELGSQSVETAELLRKTGVMYRHIVCEKNATDIKDRGTYQRNTALAHIEHHRLDGIVYFADDDNVYTLQLFEQIRNIRRFGTWPVGMLAHSKNKAILEGPVCTGKQVIGWHTNEKSKRLRRFHVDMSGFAFNSTILWDPQRWGRHSSRPIRQLDTVKEGFQETTFIEQVVEDEFQMEGVPENCSKIMVWHLHLEAPQLVYPPGWIVDKNLDVVVPVKMSTDRML